MLALGAAAGLALVPRRIVAAECSGRFVDRIDRGRLQATGIIPYELARLRGWITPNASFFVRNHFGVPSVRGWRLEVSGRVARPGPWTLEALRRLPRSEEVVTLECAGNSLAQAQGLVSTARWAGTRLRDLLESVEPLSQEDEIVFTGADAPFEHGERYARSMKLRGAVAEGALLAWEMNAEPLPRDHGAPLRLIVPGWYGMASVKWLTRIEIRSEPFDGRYQKQLYVNPRRVADGSMRMEPVTRVGLKSMVASLEARGGGVRFCGAAWGGEGSIQRVEVTFDGGAHWVEALLGEETAPGAWRLWRCDWRPPGPGRYSVASRAFTALEAQPLVRPPELAEAPYARNEVVARPLEVSCA